MKAAEYSNAYIVIKFTLHCYGEGATRSICGHVLNVNANYIYSVLYLSMAKL